MHYFHMLPYVVALPTFVTSIASIILSAMAVIKKTPIPLKSWFILHGNTFMLALVCDVVLQMFTNMLNSGVPTRDLWQLIVSALFIIVCGTATVSLDLCDRLSPAYAVLALSQIIGVVLSVHSLCLIFSHGLL